MVKPNGMNNRLSVLGLLVVLSVAGCRTPVRPSVNMKFRPTRGIMWLDEPVLLLPPVSANPLLDDTCRTIGRHLALEMTKFASSQVVYGADVRGLQNQLNWENLAGEGAVAPEEAMAMAAVASCRSVVTVRLLESIAYSPQRLAMQIRWWDAQDGTLIQQSIQDLNLADSEVRRLYAIFVDDYGFFRPRAGKHELDQFDTALYSPQVFLRFASVIAAQALVRAVPVEITPISQKWANSLGVVLQQSKLAQFFRQDN